MPVKNVKRKTDDGFEGVITGLNDKEKEILKEDGIASSEEVEKIVKEMPTDINVDKDGYAILEHDGKEITGQKKNVKFAQTDKSASFSEVTIPSASDLKTKDGTGFGEDILDWSDKTIDDENGLILTTEMSEELTKHSRMKVNTSFGIITFDYKYTAIEEGVLSLVEGIALVTGNSNDIRGALYFVYLATGAQSALKFAAVSLPIGVKFDHSFNSITFSLSSSDNTEVYLKTINGQSIADSNESTNIKVQEPLVSGTNIKTINGNSVLGAGDIPVQQKLYRHTITIYEGNTKDGNSICFTAYTPSNTPVDSIQDLTANADGSNKLANTDLNCFGVSGTASALVFYNKIHVGTSISNTTLQKVTGGSATLASVYASYTMTDDVTLN